MDALNERYTLDYPTLQNAVDIFKGQWISGFPTVSVQSGGVIPLFQDGRIDWLIQRNIADWPSLSVAELGSFEGGHSFMMHSAGAKRIVAIEGNDVSYLKGLIVKECFGLDRVQLRYGEIERWLSETDETFDLLVASGVLYHFSDPLQAIYKMTRIADRIFIWTHFVHKGYMPEGDPRWQPFTGEIERRNVDGFESLYYQRSYLGAETTAAFCGGIRPSSVWMEHDAIVYALNHWGFLVEEVIAQPDHQNGPSSCFYAWKPRRARIAGLSQILRMRDWLRVTASDMTRRISKGSFGDTHGDN